MFLGFLVCAFGSEDLLISAFGGRRSIFFLSISAFGNLASRILISSFFHSLAFGSFFIYPLKTSYLLRPREPRQPEEEDYSSSPEESATTGH
jgi:hypothetical protein